jgi:hypothetical protein
MKPDRRDSTRELLIPSGKFDSAGGCCSVAYDQPCHHDVQNEEKMVDCVEDLVGDAVPKYEVSPIMNTTRNCVTSAHDLRREPLAVILFIENAKDP